jgi:hypothetical protein
VLFNFRNEELHYFCRNITVCGNLCN